MNKICFLTVALSIFLSSPAMAGLKCDHLPDGSAANCVWIDGYRDPMTVITTPPASPAVLKNSVRPNLKKPFKGKSITECLPRIFLQLRLLRTFWPDVRAASK